MNWDQIKGNWKQTKGEVQKQWGKLTNDDLDVVEGERTKLAGRLQERYGYAKEQANKEIDTWLGSYRHLWNSRLDRLDDYLQELKRKEANDDSQ